MQKKLTIDENFSFALQNQQKNNFQIAEKFYAEVLDIDPNHIDTLNNLGLLFIKLKHYQKAISCYEKVIEIDPNYIHSPNFNLGLIFHEMKEPHKAITYYEKALQINPNYVNAHNNLGNCQKDLKEYDKAIQCYEKAIKIDPNYVSALNNLGKVFNELGKFHEATNYFNKSLKLSNDTQIHYHLGLSLYSIKLFKNAAEHFKLTNFKNSKTYLSSCLYELDEKSLFLNELENLKNQGVTNALIGSLCLRSNIKYGIQNTNSFCNDPLNYVSTINLNEQYDFKKTFINVVTDTLKNDKIVNRQQGLLTNGLQTSGNLFSLKNDHLDEIKKIIDTEIKKYQVHFKDSVEGLIKSWPTSYDINGWLISMKNGGKLSPHMHTRGWLSGSIYINVPPKIKKDSGNLVLCTEDINSGNEMNNNMKTIDVVTGSLCLFPASLFHYTIPFESEEERTVLAFDVEPIN